MNRILYLFTHSYRVLDGVGNSQDIYEHIISYVYLYMYIFTNRHPNLPSFGGLYGARYQYNINTYIYTHIYRGDCILWICFFLDSVSRFKKWSNVGYHQCEQHQKYVALKDPK